jgi:hypothetical protein
MDNRWFPDQALDDAGGRVPPWVPVFLAEIIVTGDVEAAVLEAGIELVTALELMEAEPAFLFYWDRALRMHQSVAAGVPYSEAAGEVEADVH